MAWTFLSILTSRTFPSSMPSTSTSTLSRGEMVDKEVMSFSLYSLAIFADVDSC